MLGIAYCASIGGVGMLTGTGPNLIAAQAADERYKFSVNFVNWASFATPLSVLMTIITWVVLVFVFLRDSGISKTFRKAHNPFFQSRTRSIKKNRQGRRRKLSRTNMLRLERLPLPKKWSSNASSCSWPFGSLVRLVDLELAGRNFSNLAIQATLLLRSSSHSCSSCSPLKNLSSATKMANSSSQNRSSLGSKWLRKCPGELFFSSAAVSPWPLGSLPQVILTVEYLVFNTNTVGLGKFVGLKMQALKGLPSYLMVLVCCLTINLMSQVTSNSSTMTIFASILCDMAENLNINPMFILIPSTAAVSFAFSLPVSTPPNAVVFEYGKQNSELNESNILFLRISVNAGHGQGWPSAVPDRRFSVFCGYSIIRWFANNFRCVQPMSWISDWRGRVNANLHAIYKPW